MATSIFFTESRDFKLIKERILSQEDIYLVYVFADTTNIRIPKELIRELPVYGNNLIWVDTANMDFTDISNHIILTIGQLMDPEEEISFYIVSRTSKMEKTVFFLRNQGIPVEIIGPEPKISVQEVPAKKGRTVKRKEKAPKEKPEKGKIRGRGRPKKEKPVAIVEAVTEAPKKRGRPKKEKPVAESSETPAVLKKRGRPKKESAEPAKVEEKPKKKPGRQKKIVEIQESVEAESVVQPVKRGRKKTEAAPEKPKVKKSRKKPASKIPASKKVKVKKEVAARKPRIEKVLSSEEVDAKAASYNTSDSNVETVLKALIPMKKVSRPKLTGKLIELIKGATAEDDTVAEQILNQLVELGFVDTSGTGGRLNYKD